MPDTPPIAVPDCAALFRPLHAELMALLRGFAPADWDRPTVAGAWTVRDVAAHLLDGDLRYLAVTRDGHVAPPAVPILGPADVARHVHAQNATAVAWARRLSPRTLIELHADVGPRVADVVERLDSDAAATFGVSWAGEMTSSTRFDVAREYTERWHHQQQVRDATGAPLLLDDRWLLPLLATAVRALPPRYADVAAPPGTAVGFIVGDAFGCHVARDVAGWTLRAGVPDGAAATVSANRDAAWRLFFNALPDPVRAPGIAVHGDAALAAPLLAARAIVP
jgi:uncharacterized protein (TIGR03083 family)